MACAIPQIYQKRDRIGEIYSKIGKKKAIVQHRGHCNNKKSEIQTEFIFDSLRAFQFKQYRGKI